MRQKSSLFLTQVNSQGFVFLHLFLEIHDRRRGQIWSTKGSFLGEYEVRLAYKLIYTQNFRCFTAIFWNNKVILGWKMYFILDFAKLNSNLNFKPN